MLADMVIACAGLPFNCQFWLSINQAPQVFKRLYEARTHVLRTARARRRTQ